MGAAGELVALGLDLLPDHLQRRVDEGEDRARRDLEQLAQLVGVGGELEGAGHPQLPGDVLADPVAAQGARIEPAADEIAREVEDLGPAVGLDRLAGVMDVRVDPAQEVGAVGAADPGREHGVRGDRVVGAGERGRVDLLDERLGVGEHRRGRGPDQLPDPRRGRIPAGGGECVRALDARRLPVDVQNAQEGAADSGAFQPFASAAGPVTIRGSREPRPARPEMITETESPAAETESTHVDVLIVGAGVSGIACAYHLQDEQPQKTYAIIEARAGPRRHVGPVPLPGDPLRLRPAHLRLRVQALDRREGDRRRTVDPGLPPRDRGRRTGSIAGSATAAASSGRASRARRRCGRSRSNDSRAARPTR